MKASSYYSEKERTDIVTLELTHRDKVNCVNSREIIADVRQLIAREITSLIMKKLAPVIDKFLSKLDEQ